MTIASNPINNQNTAIDINTRITKEIFYWKAKPIEQSPEVSTDSHCLLRTYIFPETADKPPKIVIIASELFSNEYNVSAGFNFATFVEAVLKHKTPIFTKCLSSIVWITHYGQFGYPLSWSETHHKDEFYLENVSQQENQIVTSDGEDINSQKVSQILNGLILEPVVEVLRQLKHDNGWDGVVNDFQVQACHELKMGIVLGTVTNPGGVWS